MSFYLKLLNSILGKWVGKYIGNQKIWVNSIADGQLVADEDKPVETTELVNLINHRFDPTLRRESLSAIYGEPDFLPFSFLQKGIECGAAVCRLVRSYGCSHQYFNSLENQPTPQQNQGLEKLIQDIKRVNQNRVDNNLPPFTCTDLAEILGIEDKPGPQGKEAFFSGFESTPLDALSVNKLRVFMPMPFGSGFLVGKNYLMTNHHVLQQAEEAGEFLAQFGYEKDLFGRTTLPVEYELNTNFFVTSPRLDYTLVKLHPESHLGEAGENFGYLRMLKNPNVIAPPLTIEEAEELAIEVQLEPEVQKRLRQETILKNQTPGLPGEPVNIIQHPKGQPKQIVLSSNRMLEITHNYLRYEADANFSSSGSPVLNQQWQLVGLHHAALADEKHNIVGQEGIRICRIVEDLENKQDNLDKAAGEISKAARVVEDLTFRWESIQATIESGILENSQLSPIQASKDADRLAPVIFQALQEAIAKQDETPIKLNFIKERGMSYIKECLKAAERLCKDVEYDRFKVTSLYDNLNQLSDDLNQLKSAISFCAQEISEFLRDFVDIPERLSRSYGDKFS